MSRCTPSVLGAAMVLAAIAACAAAEDARQALKTACSQDYKTHCAGVMPGGGRIKRCMEEHAASLSDACREALKKQDAEKAARESQGKS